MESIAGKVHVFSPSNCKPAEFCVALDAFKKTFCLVQPLLPVQVQAVETPTHKSVRVDTLHFCTSKSALSHPALRQEDAPPNYFESEVVQQITKLQV